MVELLFSDIMKAYHSLELSETEIKERERGIENLTFYTSGGGF